MESDQWKKIEKLFHDALELDPARRGAFLDNACAAIRTSGKSSKPF